MYLMGLGCSSAGRVLASHVESPGLGAHIQLHREFKTSLWYISETLTQKKKKKKKTTELEAHLIRMSGKSSPAFPFHSI